ncbi:DUF2531 family protein [Klebsiella pneumoniae]|uniref:DUF2531 family protein n=1 Tax=Klebsiella pneumoniae TaxID=573 RepID=UPI0021F3C075|nr:DUF2531 family protein [Klebsiella pneumoniae]
MPAFEWVHVQLHQQKGMISLSPPTICNSAGWTGFLQDGNGKWRRVRMDEQLPTGWRVSRLTAGELDIVTSSGCEPPAWRWQREGKQHDAMDKPAASAAAAGGGPRRPQ